MVEKSYDGILGSLRGWYEKMRGRPLQVDYGQAEYMIDKNIASEKQIGHLHELVTYNRRLMEKARVSRKRMLAEYQTHLLSENGAPKQVIINKQQDAVRIWLQNMATGSPRLSVDTEFPELRNFAWSFEHANNKHLDECRIGVALAQGTFDSFFAPGVFKTGLAAGAPEVVEEEGNYIDPGMCFTDAIDFDNCVMDMSASNPEKCKLIGDRYLRPRGWVKEQLKKAKRGEPTGAGISSYRDLENRGEDMSSGHDRAQEHKVYDSVWVWDWYLPNENVIIQIPAGETQPIGMFEWPGPDGGPYDILNLYPFSGSPIGPPPGMSLFELHLFINQTMRKVREQTKNAKDLILIEDGMKKAGEVIQQANDQMIAYVPNGSIERMKQMTTGTANPQLNNMLTYTMQVHDTEGGNLSSLGGLGPSAETFRGDKLIHDTASSLIRFLQTRLQNCVSDILKKHAWWVWTEDIRNYGGKAEIPGTGVHVPWDFTAEEREGNYLDYNFTIAPYSMQRRTPDEKAQMVIQLWQGFVMQSAEMLQQDGWMPNAVETARYLCKQWDVPFDILFKAMDPRAQSQMRNEMVDAPPRMAQKSETVNVRESRPGTTPQGTDNAFMDANAAMAKSQAATANQGGGL